MSIEKQLEEYRQLKILLADTKEKEMIMRVELADKLGKGMEAGTHNFPEYTGLKVKLVTKLTYSINKTILETLDLSEEEAECIRWKPELNLTKFKQSETDNLDDAITVKNAAPTLTVELI